MKETLNPNPASLIRGTRLIAIDPGTQHMGIACFHRSASQEDPWKLMKSECISPNMSFPWQQRSMMAVRSASHWLAKEDYVIIEYPHYFQSRLANGGMSSSADSDHPSAGLSDSLIKVAFEVGALCQQALSMHACRVWIVRPSYWKAQLNKVLVKERLARHPHLGGVISGFLAQTDRVEAVGLGCAALGWGWDCITEAHLEEVRT